MAFPIENDARQGFVSHGMPEGVISLFSRWFDGLVSFTLARASHEHGGAALSGEEVTSYRESFETAQKDAEELAEYLAVFMNQNEDGKNRAKVLLALANTDKPEFEAFRNTSLETLAAYFGAWCIRRRRNAR